VTVTYPGTARGFGHRPPSRGQNPRETARIRTYLGRLRGPKRCYICAANRQVSPARFEVSEIRGVPGSSPGLAIRCSARSVGNSATLPSDGVDAFGSPIGSRGPFGDQKLAPWSRFTRCSNCAYTSIVILESACPTCAMTHFTSKLFASSAIEIYVRRSVCGDVFGSGGSWFCASAVHLQERLSLLRHADAHPLGARPVVLQVVVLDRVVKDRREGVDELADGRRPERLDSPIARVADVRARLDRLTQLARLAELRGLERKAELGVDFVQRVGGEERRQVQQSPPVVVLRVLAQGAVAELPIDLALQPVRRVLAEGDSQVPVATRRSKRRRRHGASAPKNAAPPGRCTPDARR